MSFRCSQAFGSGIIPCLHFPTNSEFCGSSGAAHTLPGSEQGLIEEMKLIYEVNLKFILKLYFYFEVYFEVPRSVFGEESVLG